MNINMTSGVSKNVTTVSEDVSAKSIGGNCKTVSGDISRKFL